MTTSKDLGMQLHPPRENLAPWFRPLRELAGPVTSASLFDNDAPLEIEVGSGRGLFLYNESLEHPDRNFVGVEIDFKEGRRAAGRLKRRGATNAVVLGGDATEALSKFMPPASVSVLHIYFPDPWWKRKHKKRRVFNDVFVSLAAKVLPVGHLLRFATDVAEYAEVVYGLMDHDPRFRTAEAPHLQVAAAESGYATGFEKRALALGETIHRTAWERV